MKKYDRLILKKDAEAIADLFLPEGELGDMARGRDSIRAFLSSFTNVVVLSQKSTTSDIKIEADTAIQSGSYSQVDLVNGKDTVKVKGNYTVRWQWVKNSGWLISKINTTTTN